MPLSFMYCFFSLQAIGLLYYLLLHKNSRKLEFSISSVVRSVWVALFLYVRGKNLVSGHALVSPALISHASPASAAKDSRARKKKTTFLL